MAEETEPSQNEVEQSADAGWDFVLRQIGVRGTGEAFFEPVEVEAPRGKVVAMDAAVMAAHLFSATIVFRSVPKVMEGAIKDMQKAAAKLALTAGSYLLKAIGGWLRFVVGIVAAWDEEKTGRALEARIRAASATMRRQLIEVALSQSAPRRGRRIVWSRHFTPRQRKPNQSWQTKPPRKR